MAATKLHGKAGKLFFGATSIPLTKATIKWSKDLADATDSDDYDSGTAQLYQNQRPGKVGVELSIEGFYDTGTTPTNVTDAMLTDTVVAATVKPNGSANTINGNFDMNDYTETTEINGMVAFSATLKSRSLFTRT